MIHLVPMIAETATRMTFQWGRIQANADWLLPGGIFAALALFVIMMYRYDSVGIGAKAAALLVVLRLLAAAGLVMLYAEPQWRTEKRVARDSRVLVLADTSRSMSRRDDVSGPASSSRSEQLVAELSQGELLPRLRQDHDVIVARFDEESSRIVTLDKVVPTSKKNDAPTSVEPRSAFVAPLRHTAFSACGLFGLCLLGYPIMCLLRRKVAPPWPWVTLAALSLIVAAGSLAWIDLTHPSTPLAVLLDLPIIAEEEPPGLPVLVQNDDESAGVAGDETIDWPTALSPLGNESRLGQALLQWIYQQRSAPLAGVIVVTDGGLNAGVKPQAAIALARENRISIFAIGMGSQIRPVNVAVSGLIAPPRAYPGDDFTVTGYLQADGLAGKTVTVELSSVPAGGNADTPPQSEAIRRIELGEDGQVTTIKFDIDNSSEEKTGQNGRRVYTLKVDPPTDDTNPRDNHRSEVVEIVDRQSRILLMASGPTREYRFLRNLLYRDDNTTVDVILQTAQAGIVQDADALLDEFPISPTELARYDCIVAIDFDWRVLDEDQVSMLEKWVATQAGGLIVTAGPVATSRWVNDHRTRRKMAKIRNLYPVKFRTSFSDLVEADDDRFQRDEAHPLQFTREGLDAPFLWLGDTAVDSEQAWALTGVYGYFSVADAKPGAVVYAEFGDPEAAIEIGKPIYLAEQFYGAGRVLYQGSGEFWRLRAVDESHFETLYTKLIRHVSQGRMLRGSRRGVLSVGRDRAVVGATIDLRANLSDRQQKPLTEPQVTLQVVAPDGTPTTMTLAKNDQQDGLYEGQLLVVQEGLYRLELEVPNADGEILTKSIDVQIPNLERDHSMRNDKLLAELTEGTGGQYFVGLTGADQVDRLAAQLPDATQISYETGILDRTWETKWMRWMMVLVCGCLCLEWLLRRLLKLA